MDLAALLRQTLRLTPDRIVLGEVRGPEALELVRAMNTGHDGTLCTLHSNGAGEALRRLHTLVAEAQPGFPFEGVLSAVDHVLQLEGRGDGRRLADIWPVPRGGSGRGARAVSGAAPRSHGPAGEGASLLKPLVAKRRAADHGAAPAPSPGRPSAAPSPPAEETSMT